MDILLENPLEAFHWTPGFQVHRSLCSQKITTMRECKLVYGDTKDTCITGMTGNFQCLPVVKRSLICNLLNSRSIVLAGSYLRSPTGQMSRVWGSTIWEKLQGNGAVYNKNTTKQNNNSSMVCAHTHHKTRLMCPEIPSTKCSAQLQGEITLRKLPKGCATAVTNIQLICNGINRFIPVIKKSETGSYLSFCN
jgi:hypothetical protein